MVRIFFKENNEIKECNISNELYTIKQLIQPEQSDLIPFDLLETTFTAEEVDDKLEIIYDPNSEKEDTILCSPSFDYDHWHGIRFNLYEILAILENYDILNELADLGFSLDYKGELYYDMITQGLAVTNGKRDFRIEITSIDHYVLRYLIINLKDDFDHEQFYYTYNISTNVLKKLLKTPLEDIALEYLLQYYEDEIGEISTENINDDYLRVIIYYYCNKIKVIYSIFGKKNIDFYLFWNIYQYIPDEDKCIHHAIIRIIHEHIEILDIIRILDEHIKIFDTIQASKRARIY